MNDYLISVILGIIEGLTEFLPVSSTAHLRLASAVLKQDLEDPYWKMYSVVIQLGAVLAVVVYFRTRIMQFLRSFPTGTHGDRTALTHPLTLVIGAFAVTAGPAYLLDKTIGENLESLHVIGWALIIGGIVMYAVDRIYGDREQADATATDATPTAPDADATQPTAHRGRTMDSMHWMQAIFIGAAQILAAAFPGVSRSMATIAAGQVAGLTRPAALEFSFFLSIPVMFAATGFKLLQAIMGRGSAEGETLVMDGHRWGVLAVGFVVSFVVAWAVIAWFMAWVRRHGFTAFALYRFGLGIIVLIAASKT